MFQHTLVHVISIEIPFDVTALQLQTCIANGIEVALCMAFDCCLTLLINLQSHKNVHYHRPPISSLLKGTLSWVHVSGPKGYVLGASHFNR